jgi:ATP-dependent helicase HrpA
VLGQLQPVMFDWLVPGLLRDKVIALIKTLPKAIRKSFVPVPDYADAFLQTAPRQTDPLLNSLAHYLQKTARLEVPVSAFQRDNLAEFYRMNFRVVDPQGKVLGSGRDLEALQGELSALSESAFTTLPVHPLERGDVTQWDFGDLPEVVELEQQGLTIRAWPALVDEGESVAIRLFNDEQQAHRHMQQGLRRLFRLTSRQQMKYLSRNMPHLDKILLHYASIGNRESLIQDLEQAIIDTALFSEISDIRTEKQFHQSAEQARARLMQVANDTCELVNDIMSQHHKLAKQLQGNIPLAWFDAIKDIRQQLACLVYPGFISAIPRQWLRQLPRYLKAIALRLEKLQRAPAVDKQRQRELQAHWDRVFQKISENPGQALDSTWETYRWMVEEMRVSLFAQELKTFIPVSIKKLDEQYRLLKKL